MQFIRNIRIIHINFSGCATTTTRGLKGRYILASRSQQSFKGRICAMCWNLSSWFEFQNHSFFHDYKTQTGQNFLNVDLRIHGLQNRTSLPLYIVSSLKLKYKKENFYNIACRLLDIGCSQVICIYTYTIQLMIDR